MRIAAIVVALLLAACNQPASPPESSAAETQAAKTAEAPNGCPATASFTWRGDGGELAITASTAGADCAQANATIVLRDVAGAVLHTQSYPASQVMTLVGAESVEDMQRRLAEWITPAGAAADSTGDLPEWTQGAQEPSDGEFPFHPDEAMDRAAYEALRARDAGMYCYVQGMESQSCVTVENGALVKIGLQTFPG